MSLYFRSCTNPLRDVRSRPAREQVQLPSYTAESEPFRADDPRYPAAFAAASRLISNRMLNEFCCWWPDLTWFSIQVRLDEVGPDHVVMVATATTEPPMINMIYVRASIGRGD